MATEFQHSATPMRLHCTGGKQFTGYFCTVDPSSGNVVLCSLTNKGEEDKAKIFIVSGWSINKAEILEEPECNQQMRGRLEQLLNNSRLSSSLALSPPTEETVSLPPGPSLETRRAVIIDHFARSSIPVDFLNDGELISLNNGTILITPPYLPSCCQGSNAVVLKRVQDILDRLEIH